MQQVSIARASLKELDDVAELFDQYRRFYGQKSDPASCRRFIQERIERNESMIFVAMQNEPIFNQIMGFMQLYPVFSSISLKPVWILNDLYVIESARKNGIGKKLVSEAKKLVRETGATGLVLETSKTNFAAQHLYLSTGFHVDEIFDRYCYTT